MTHKRSLWKITFVYPYCCIKEAAYRDCYSCRKEKVYTERLLDKPIQITAGLFAKEPVHQRVHQRTCNQNNNREEAHVIGDYGDLDICNHNQAEVDDQPSYFIAVHLPGRRIRRNVIKDIKPKNMNMIV